MRELCYVLQLGIVDRMKILKNWELIDGKHFLLNGMSLLYVIQKEASYR